MTYFQPPYPSPTVLPQPEPIVNVPLMFLLEYFTYVSKEVQYNQLLMDAYLEARNRNLHAFANWFKEKLGEAGIDVS